MADIAKGIVVTTDCTAYIGEFPYPLHRSCKPTLDGYIETVHPRGLARPYMMLVNEEGLLKGLPLNPLGSLLYGTLEHGYPIVGNVIFMKDGYRNGEPDIVGLDDEDIGTLLSRFVELGVTPKETGNGSAG